MRFGVLDLVVAYNRFMQKFWLTCREVFHSSLILKYKPCHAEELYGRISNLDAKMLSSPTHSPCAPDHISAPAPLELGEEGGSQTYVLDMKLRLNLLE